MFRIFKYSHISAKIKAMKGKMLTEEDYQTLMKKTNVSEIATYLKYDTYYSNALQDLNEANVHRGYLEILLYQAEIADALKIARYTTGDDKTIYRYVYRKYEIEDLKKMLRTLQMGKSLTEIDRKILFISKYSKINFKEALKAKNILELVESVKGTNFYGILKPLIIDSEHIDLFAAEMALDLYYFTRLVGQIKMFKGSEKETLYSLFGADADMKNIFWIYRGKKYYQIHKEMLYRYLIPLSYKLHKSEIVKMVEAQDIEEFMEVLSTTYYKDYLGDNPNEWGHKYSEFVLKVQGNNIQRDPYSLAPIVGYMMIKELEIHNIISIIEGVRYQVLPEEISKQIVRHTK